jgi:hypothetical protein
MPQVHHAVPLSEVVVTEHIGFWETQIACTKGVWNDEKNRHQVVLNCFTNLCFVPACSIVHGEDDYVTSCEIYMWADFENLRLHEEEHCKGYKDVLY